MSRRVRLLFCVMMFGWLFAVLAPRFRTVEAAGTQQSTASAQTSPSAVLNQYCIRCHNQTAKVGGLALDKIDLTNVGTDAQVWEKVIRKLHMGAMPPPGSPRPDASATTALLGWVETALDSAALASPNPGRTDALHRLNRVEYKNAIRDLLDLDIDVAAMLPVDDADAVGFDNIASLLSVSPTLLDRYLSTARKVSRLAVGLPPIVPVAETFKVPEFSSQTEQSSEDLPFGSRGGTAIHYYVPVDGDYVVRIKLRRQLYDYITGLAEAEQLEVRVDGKRVKTFEIGGQPHGKPAPASYAGDVLGDHDWEQYALSADEGLEVPVPIKAGPRVIGVSFVGKFKEIENSFQVNQKYSDVIRDETRPQAVDSVEISGPYRAAGSATATPSRTRIFTCRPEHRSDEDACAKKILSAVARRAYRRPVTDKDVQGILSFFTSGRRDGDFDAGIQFALERILADPSFLFRVERDPEKVAPGTAYRISPLELASRLSFFLWSSIPDDELLDLATRGKLAEPAILEQQVRRMLNDRRSRALVDNFVGQWLLARNVRGWSPDPDLYSDFDEKLREGFQLETELFVDSQLREDKSVPELLSANYTYMNERLARHYEVPNVYGDYFRRVTFPKDSPRGGLLGQGGLLMVTSYPNRTSPVLRGKWVLDSLLGTPPPPPPPNVPGLKERGANGKPASVRERLEEHRSNAVCASCHSQMDPLGFALENFDAIGQWRTKGEGGAPIDAAAALPNGTTFSGPNGLRSMLLSRQDQFVNAMTEKLMAYALGRALEYYDLPTVRRITRESAAGGYRWSAIISGIVKSPAFLERMSAPPPAQTATGASGR